MAADASAAQPEGRSDVGTNDETGRRLAPEASHPSSLAKRPLRRQTPKVGAECPNRARSDLCGGRAVMRVPTAIRRVRRAEAYPRRLTGCGKSRGNDGSAPFGWFETVISGEVLAFGLGIRCVFQRIPGFGTDSGRSYAAAPSSFGSRTKLYAAALRVNIQPTRAVPRCRVLRKPAAAFVHPNTSSIRLRLR